MGEYEVVTQAGSSGHAGQHFNSSTNWFSIITLRHTRHSCSTVHDTRRCSFDIKYQLLKPLQKYIWLHNKELSYCC